MTSHHSDAKTNVSSRDLRKFGLSTGTAFILILGLLVPWVFRLAIPLWPFALGAALIGPALLFPRLLRPVHRVWMAAAEKIGAFNARVLLSVAFYAILTPTGLIRRLLGHDSLGLRTTGSTSFRKRSRQRARESMERPF